MPFKTKPIAPIKPDTSALQPKNSVKTSQAQTALSPARILGKSTQSKAVVAKAIAESDQKKTSSKSSEVITKNIKFKIPLKLYFKKS